MHTTAPLKTHGGNRGNRISGNWDFFLFFGSVAWRPRRKLAEGGSGVYRRPSPPTFQWHRQGREKIVCFETVCNRRAFCFPLSPRQLCISKLIEGGASVLFLRASDRCMRSLPGIQCEFCAINFACPFIFSFFGFFYLPTVGYTVFLRSLST